MEELLVGRKTRKLSGVGFKKMTPVEKMLWVLASIAVIFGAITMLFPFYWMFVSSIKSYSENMSTTLVMWPSNPNWAIFGTLFEDNSFNLLKAMGNTMLIEVPVIIVGTLVSTMCAFAFAKLKFRHKKLIFICLMTTMMIPFAAVMLPQYRVWEALGITASDGFIRLLPLIVPGLFGNIGMTFFLLTSMKNSIHDSVIESAKVDGCSYFKMWWQLALPLSKNAIAAQIIFWFVGIWNDYFAPSMYLTGETKTVQVVVTSMIDSQGTGLGFDKMMAAAFLASIPMIVVFIVFRNMFVSAGVNSGVKE